MINNDFASVSQDEMDSLIQALKVPQRRREVADGVELMQKIAAQGWAAHWHFDDLILFQDNRIDETHLGRITQVACRMGLEPRFAYSQENDLSDSPTGYKMFRASSVACYLIWLERVGFLTDATLLCEGIVERLDRQIYVSEDELTVLLYSDNRHAMAPVTIQVEPFRSPVGRTEVFKNVAEYRIEIMHDSDDKPVLLEIHSPNYVEPRPQKSITCEECNFSYVSGIRSDEHTHRINHNKIVTTLKPVISRALKAAVNDDPSSVWVTESSPSWSRHAVYRRAKAFKREMHFDFTQWEIDSDPDATGFLFHDDEFRIVGACSFRRETDLDHDLYRLDWIWICPGSRRKGYLTRNWDLFQERFGEFKIAPPVSDAMQAFLRKRGLDHLIPQ